MRFLVVNGVEKSAVIINVAFEAARNEKSKVWSHN
jgi:hypothetical protein